MPPSDSPGGGQPLGSEYMVFELIGRGAMGEVHRARTRAGQPVAVKLLRPELGNDPQLVSRFLQERTILTGLTHPNVVQVRDLVAEGTTLAIVMDLINGHDLRTELTHRGNLPPAEAVSLMVNVLHGLAAVHAAGVVHRDLKPENVLLDTVPQTGQRLPRITDFGISSLAQTTRGSHRTGAIGTPEYMAPELIGDASPSRSSDLYAVGIMLYELLCGVSPFRAQTALALMHKQVNQQPGRPGGITDGLWSVISALLLKDPQQRPQDARQVAGWLQQMLPELMQVPAAPLLTDPPEPPPASRPAADRDAETLIRPIPAGNDTAGADRTERQGRGRRNALIAAALVVLLAVIGGASYLVLGRGSDPDPGPVPSPTGSPTQAPATTPATTSPAPTPTGSQTPVIPESATPGPNPEVGYLLPDYKGRQLSDVVADLAAHGLGYTTKLVYDPAARNNEVTAQVPAAGEAAGSRVALTVSRIAVATYLADLGALGTSPDVGPQDLSRTTYPHALSTSICFSSAPTVWEYNLSENYTRLSGIAGMVDNSSSQEKATVEIYGDDVRLFGKSVILNKPARYNLDVTGILRLKIVVTATTCSDDGISSYFAMGDPQLLSVPVPVAT